MDLLLELFADMSPSKLKSYAMIACLFGGVLLYFAMQKHTQAGLLTNLQYSSLHSFTQTQTVKVKGQVSSLSNAETYSPLSKTPAVWYSYSIEEPLEDEEGPDSYHQIDGEQSSDVFLLKNGSESCLVNPDDAEWLTVQKRVWYEADSKPNNIPSLGTEQANTNLADYRFTEVIVQANENIHIIGEATNVPAYLEKHQQETGAKCLISAPKNKQHPLFISNENIDKIDQKLAKQSKLMLAAGFILLLLSFVALIAYKSKSGL